MVLPLPRFSYSTHRTNLVLSNLSLHQLSLCHKRKDVKSRLSCIQFSNNSIGMYQGHHHFIISYVQWFVIIIIIGLTWSMKPWDEFHYTTLKITWLHSFFHEIDFWYSIIWCNMNIMIHKDNNIVLSLNHKSSIKIM